MNVRFYLSYDIKITLTSHFCLKNVIILSSCTQRCYERHDVSQKSVKPLVVYRFYCMALFHSQTQCHMIISFMAFILSSQLGSNGAKQTSVPANVCLCCVVLMIYGIYQMSCGNRDKI